MNWHKNAKKICRFVKEHTKAWADVPMGNLRAYFKWHYDRGLLAVCWHRGKVAGVGTCRCFHHRADYWQRYVHDDSGRFVKPVLYGAIHLCFVPQLVWQLAQRKGATGRLYLWHRDEDELGPPRQYTYPQFVRILTKML